MNSKKKSKFTKIFEKKKCVSIDSKCSETHRNAKKIFTPMTDFAPSGVAQSLSGGSVWIFGRIVVRIEPNISPSLSSIGR